MWGENIASENLNRYNCDNNHITTRFNS